MREYDFVHSTLICSQRFTKELAVNGSVSTIKTYNNILVILMGFWYDNVDTLLFDCPRTFFEGKRPVNLKRHESVEC